MSTRNIGKGKQRRKLNDIDRDKHRQANTPSKADTARTIRLDHTHAAEDRILRCPLIPPTQRIAYALGLQTRPSKSRPIRLMMKSPKTLAAMTLTTIKDVNEVIRDWVASGDFEHVNSYWLKRVEPDYAVYAGSRLIDPRFSVFLRQALLIIKVAGRNGVAELSDRMIAEQTGTRDIQSVYRTRKRIACLSITPTPGGNGQHDMTRYVVWDAKTAAREVAQAAGETVLGHQVVEEGQPEGEGVISLADIKRHRETLTPIPAHLVSAAVWVPQVQALRAFVACCTPERVEVMREALQLDPADRDEYFLDLAYYKTAERFRSSDEGKKWQDKMEAKSLTT